MIVSSGEIYFYETSRFTRGNDRWYLLYIAICPRHVDVSYSGVCISNQMYKKKNLRLVTDSILWDESSKVLKQWPKSLEIP
jgi:hypothetical protein